VLYQLLAVQHVSDPQHALPYLAKDATEFLESLNDPNQYIRTLPEQVPQRLAEIVERRCLCDDKTLRYRSASDLSRDLRHWLRTKNGPASAARWWRVAVPVALVLGVGAAIGASSFLTSRSRTTVESPDLPSGGESRPILAPRPLVPGSWNKVLDRPIQKLRWPGPESQSEYLEKFELEELVLIADGSALLQAVDLNSQNCHVQARFNQPSWGGKFGVIYGLKPAGDGYECGRIQLLRWVDNAGKPTFRLRRDDLTLDQNFIPRHTVGRAEQPVPYPEGSQELTFKVQDGKITQVRWGGQTLDKLIRNVGSHPPLDCRGGLGLYIDDASLTVSQLRVFVE
jgi:hypothetical protein